MVSFPSLTFNQFALSDLEFKDVIENNQMSIIDRILILQQPFKRNGY